MDYTYQIDNNGLSFPPDQPATVFAGPHIITVEDPAGCRIEEMVNIDQPAEIQVILPAELVVELGDSTARLEPIVVSSLPIDSYLWTPDTYLSSDTVQSPFIVELLESTDYNLLVTDINGCTGTADIFVELDANRNVFIPNVFSPNGDGPNDEFRIFACTGVTSINSVKVFDRWGGQVYEASGLLPVCEGGLRLWDGRKNGRLMNPGVYVYLIEIEFLDRVKLLYRGDVTLLR
jgi:gliding motility-associated-like protein